MAPFLAEKRVPIPSKDLLSWYYDAPQFDQNRPVYIDANDTSNFWTAKQCRQAIRKLAAGFLKLGLSAGDVICVHSFNSIEYPVLANGIVGFGGTFTGSNPAYTVHELTHHLRVSGARLAIVEPESLNTFLKAADAVGIPRDRVLVFSDNASQGLKSWKTLMEHGEVDWPRFNDLHTAKSTTAALLFSSGTTGLPKAAMLSHHNFVAQCTVMGDMKGSSWHKRRLVALPMFHASTVPICHFNPLFTGDAMYIVKRFDLEEFLNHIDRHAITDVSFVPPIIHRILSSELRHKFSLKSVRNSHCGAAPLDASAQARFQELLPPTTPLTQVWGMSETVATCCMTPYNEGREMSGSVGRMCPNLDIKLCDDDGLDITADNVRGELCIRGPVVVKGYHENEEANARDWDTDGFFHTGDIAYRDGTTKLWYIVDRKKELIKVRGYQVAPSELEGVLTSHPNVVDAAVIAVPSQKDKGEECPRAYIVASGVVESEIAAFMRERLATYKQCAGGIVFAHEIPRTASGKILRRVLRERAAQEMMSSRTEISSKL